MRRGTETVLPVLKGKVVVDVIFIANGVEFGAVVEAAVEGVVETVDD